MGILSYRNIVKSTREWRSNFFCSAPKECATFRRPATLARAGPILTSAGCGTILTLLILDVTHPCVQAYGLWWGGIKNLQRELLFALLLIFVSHLGHRDLGLHQPSSVIFMRNCKLGMCFGEFYSKLPLCTANSCFAASILALRLFSRRASTGPAPGFSDHGDH